MAHRLKTHDDISGLIVEVEGQRPIARRLFQVNEAPNAGFGANRALTGNAVFGRFLPDGIVTRIEGPDVVRVVSAEDAAAILAER